MADMRTIGLLGGMSDAATAAYYALINAEVKRRLGGWHSADLVIASVNFAHVQRFIQHGLWDEAGEFLAANVAGLERAGIGLLICATNTMHRVAPRFTRDLTVPFLHIVDPTAAAIRARGLRRVALLGTRATMAADFLKHRFREQHGIEIVVPTAAEQDEIDAVIFDELVHGVVRSGSKERFLEIADRLVQDGAEGLVLGCTEIFLLVGQSDRPEMPVFDTTALHAAAAVDMALAP